MDNNENKPVNHFEKREEYEKQAFKDAVKENKVRTAASLFKYLSHISFMALIAIPASFIFLLSIGSIMEHGFSESLKAFIETMQPVADSGEGFPASLTSIWLLFAFVMIGLYVYLVPWRSHAHRIVEKKMIIWDEAHGDTAYTAMTQKTESK